MKNKIAIIGLGYVGLPLLDKLSKFYKVYGFDINSKKINNLKKNKAHDELNKKKFKFFNNIFLTNKIENIKNCNVFIVCVPTPVKKNNKPDFKSIKNACISIAKILKHKDIVVFESTFYPYTVRDIIIPLVEKESKLKCAYNNQNLKSNNLNYFSIGYSPERINPGDKEHTINKVVKIVSATNSKSLAILNDIYSKIVQVGIYKIKRIEIAEASKVIENIQRDINIALMNELKMIFDKLNINFNSVLDAAQTKWNFQRFDPGMVGGHCISVDPYYLTYKAQELGYQPKILLAGRKINNEMYKTYSLEIVQLLKNKFKSNFKIRILIMGFTYKPNVSDFRNTQILNLVNYIKKIYKNIEIFDPLVNLKNVYDSHNINLIKEPNKLYDCVAVLVKHNKFLSKKSKFYYKNYCKDRGITYLLND